MKRLVIFAICALCILGASIWITQNATVTPSVPPINSDKHVTASDDDQAYIGVSYNGQAYRIYYSELSGTDITILPNFDEKRSARTIAEENECTVASSGGFYTAEDTPLGLFIANNTRLASNITTSSLLAGYFYVDATKTPHISSIQPQNAPYVIQSGPLFTSSAPFPAASDEPARRIVAIETERGTVYIAAVISEENTFDGPYLSDLPAIVFSIKEPFVPKRVLNLDGGSASYYQDTYGFSLPELVYVGSVLCSR